MSVGIENFEVVQNETKTRAVASFSSTAYHAQSPSDARVLRVEARALFVRFAIRWCQAKMEKQAQKAVA